MAVTVAAILKGLQSTIQRANRHIDELISRSSPLDRSLYEIINEYLPPTVIHLQPARYNLTYRPKEDTPETFAGIIGDALGNIRAAFDHLATGIVRNWGTTPKAPLYFPITKRKDLVAHPGLTAPPSRSALSGLAGLDVGGAEAGHIGHQPEITR